MNKYYIYRIVNKQTGEYYIGQRKCPNDIEPEDDTYFGSGSLLKIMIDELGKSNFKKQILHVTFDQLSINILESYYVDDAAISDVMCYNMVKGGAHGLHKPVSSDTLRSRQEAPLELDHFFSKLVSF